jgi:hypothetical protein
MSADPTIRGVFGHFQNLNLLVLLHDLRSGRTAHGAWSAGTRLCPVAQGMPVGQVVGDLQFLGQAAEPERACAYAARHLGADPACVYRFVELWDANAFVPWWLLRQLEDLWEERRVDADAVQELLQQTPWPTRQRAAQLEKRTTNPFRHPSR